MTQYEKLNFVNGSPPALNAATLNHMEDGIAAATEGVTAVEKTVKDNKTETNTALATKADKETTYTKSEVDTKLSGKLDNTTGSVKRENIEVDAVGADEIDSGAVNTINIADGAVTADKIASKAVTSDKIANGAITALKLANNSVSGGNIGQNQISTNHLQSGTVTTDKLADEVKTSINSKYDSSNVETGSGTLTPYTTSADIVKSANFTYQRIGRVVTVNVNIVFNAGTKSQVMFTNLPYVCKNTVNPRELCVSNSKVTRIWAINKDNTTLNIISDSSLSYAEDETLAFTLSYLIS